MAIIIFGIGIIVIMSMLSSSVRILYDIKEKDTALTIAKEWIDMVYHLRDSNIERWMYWNCTDIDFSAPDNCAEYLYTSWDVKEFTINRDETRWYQMEEVATTGDTLLYFHTWTLYSLSWWANTLDWFFYNHNATFSGVVWEETIYRRTIEIRPLSGYALWTWSVLEITSIVEYNRWSDVRDVILQSIIGDTRI